VFDRFFVFATAALSTKFGYGLPAALARDFADAFWSEVSVVRSLVATGLSFFQNAIFLGIVRFG
jgi:hypothetical protein